jgi:uncharacterized protein YbaR (Trm112 family)
VPTCPYCKNGIVIVKTKGMPKMKEPCLVCKTPSTKPAPHHVHCAQGKLTTTAHDVCTCGVLEGRK